MNKLENVVCESVQSLHKLLLQFDFIHASCCKVLQVEDLLLTHLHKVLAMSGMLDELLLGGGVHGLAKGLQEMSNNDGSWYEIRQ